MSNCCLGISFNGYYYQDSRTPGHPDSNVDPSQSDSNKLRQIKRNRRAHYRCDFISIEFV